MAADRSTIDSFAELFLEDAFAPAPATIQAVYDLFDPSAANVATMDEILSRVSANHRDVIPFLLMGTDARLRVLYDVVKVEDLLGPGRSSLANTYVGIEGDLDTLRTQKRNAKTQRKDAKTQRKDATSVECPVSEKNKRQSLKMRFCHAFPCLPASKFAFCIRIRARERVWLEVPHLI